MVTNHFEFERLIITGASTSYERSLFALIGSLNCNWPGHPPILVYNLGLAPDAVDVLMKAGLMVRDVPAFVPHWRSDFTWRPWCFHDAPAREYLWLDAGLCVLRPLDDAFEAIHRLGYFSVALYNHPVAPSVPDPLRRNAGIREDALSEMISISAGVHGIRKEGAGAELINEAYQLCLNHENMRATEPPHRHDQALLTLMLYKHFGPPLLADYHVYAYHDPSGPGIESRQKIWVHRRKMLDEDVAFFSSYVAKVGPTHRPEKRWEHPPLTPLMKLRILIAKLRGRYPGDDRVDVSGRILHGVKD